MRQNIYFDQKPFTGLILDLALVVLINTLIGFFLTSIDFGISMTDNLIFSQCIGLAIFASVRTSYPFLKRLRPAGQLAVLFTDLAVGAAAGILIGNFLGSGPAVSLQFSRPALLYKVLAASLVFGTMVSYLFISRKLLIEARSQAQEEKIQRLAREKQNLEMYLKLLQAQVEPHFLFNTLSNIQSLLTTDREKAEKMLLDLTAYLRRSLAKSRQETITVAEEMELTRSYLDIFKIRMGERLRYTIELQEGVENLVIPPMLIQPLVENSIKHGLEPAVEGGEIAVRITRSNSSIIITVDDTGVGLQDNRQPGVGTASVRERITFLYGKRASVRYVENRPHGLKVCVDIPVAREAAF